MRKCTSPVPMNHFFPIGFPFPDKDLLALGKHVPVVPLFPILCVNACLSVWRLTLVRGCCRRAGFYERLGYPLLLYFGCILVPLFALYRGIYFVFWVFNKSD